MVVGNVAEEPADKQTDFGLLCTVQEWLSCPLL